MRTLLAGIQLTCEIPLPLISDAEIMSRCKTWTSAEILENEDSLRPLARQVAIDHIKAWGRTGLEFVYCTFPDGVTLFFRKPPSAAEIVGDYRATRKAMEFELSIPEGNC